MRTSVDLEMIVLAVTKIRFSIAIVTCFAVVK